MILSSAILTIGMLFIDGKFFQNLDDNHNPHHAWPPTHVTQQCSWSQEHSWQFFIPWNWLSSLMHKFYSALCSLGLPAGARRIRSCQRSNSEVSYTSGMHINIWALSLTLSYRLVDKLPKILRRLRCSSWQYDMKWNRCFKISAWWFSGKMLMLTPKW